MSAELLLRHLAASTLALAVVALASRPARRSASARHRLLAWGLVATLLLPLAHAFVPAWRVLPARRSAGVPATPLAPSSGVVPDLWRNSWPDRWPELWPDLWRDRLDGALVAAWGAASSVLLARLVLALLAQRRLARRAHAPDRETRQALAGAARALGLGAAPRCGIADVPGPMVVGALVPAVVLPPGCARWSHERRRLVLMHELAHVRRRDVRWLALGRLALALNPFQPLAWLAYARLRRAQEEAADDLVLAAGAPPAAYARHLLDLAAGPRPRFASAAGATAGVLEQRLRRILDPSARRAASPVALPLGACAACVLLVASAAPALAPELVRRPVAMPGGLVLGSDGRVRGVVQRGSVPLVGWISPRGTVVTEGDVRFLAGGRVELGRGAYALCEIPRAGSFERVEVRADASGATAYRRTHGGRDVDPDEAPAWLAQHLPACLAVLPLEPGGERLRGAAPARPAPDVR